MDHELIVHRSAVARQFTPTPSQVLGYWVKLHYYTAVVQELEFDYYCTVFMAVQTELVKYTAVGEVILTAVYMYRVVFAKTNVEPGRVTSMFDDFKYNQTPSSAARSLRQEYDRIRPPTSVVDWQQKNVRAFHSTARCLHYGQIRVSYSPAW